MEPTSPAIAGEVGSGDRSPDLLGLGAKSGVWSVAEWLYRGTGDWRNPFQGRQAATEPTVPAGAALPTT
ncbi:MULTISPECIES: hypothetical protein [unclassified Streptomyces]|uniref:hypothetical protein n=1 Tax=unclassified Streptomyces TaxID=2593676 RepID=UPI0037FD9C29